MLGSIIKAIHMFFLIFIVFTPFLGNEILLTYHFIAAPFLLLHWITNNDTCALTIMESKLTGKPDNHTFIGRIIKPIYNAHLESKHYYWILILLFLITTYRLWSKYNFWYILLTCNIISAMLSNAKKSIVSTFSST